MTSAASSSSEEPDEGAVIVASAIEVEKVGPVHAQALADLFKRNRASTVSDTFDPFELTAEQARRIAVAPRRDLFFVARLGGPLVAMSMLRGFDKGFAIPSFGIFVDHRHHGRGIGRELTTWTVKIARDQDCPAVRLSVYQSNTAALRLYRSLGFQERERTPVERADEPDEKIVMLLPLGSPDA
jgi:ribosomal protein S18 acetylase RimI-like enzyme